LFWIPQKRYDVDDKTGNSHSAAASVAAEPPPELLLRRHVVGAAGWPWPPVDNSRRAHRSGIAAKVHGEDAQPALIPASQGPDAQSPGEADVCRPHRPLPGAGHVSSPHFHLLSLSTDKRLLPLS